MTQCHIESTSMSDKKQIGTNQPVMSIVKHPAGSSVHLASFPHG
jgi:hypothetical protein